MLFLPSTLGSMKGTVTSPQAWHRSGHNWRLLNECTNALTTGDQAQGSGGSWVWPELQYYPELSSRQTLVLFPPSLPSPLGKLSGNATSSGRSSLIITDGSASMMSVCVKYGRARAVSDDLGHFLSIYEDGLGLCDITQSCQETSVAA